MTLADRHAFADLRNRVAALLAPDATDPEWITEANVVDAFTPPGYLIEWADPWVPGMQTACLALCAVDLVVIAARIEPDPGIETLEQLIEIAYARLIADGIVPSAVSRPGPFHIGGVAYLAAHVSLTLSVTLGGSTNV